MIGHAEIAVITALVREAARTEIMPRFRHLGTGDVSAKSGPQDLVTVADEGAERFLTDAFRRHFPGCAVVGEEACARTPALADALASADLALVIDPVDGTNNFAAGLPLFGVIVAVVSQGRTVAGIIHDPVGDDTAIALAGQGAWMEAPDGSRRELRVAPGVPLAEMAGIVSWRFMPEPRRGQVCARLNRVGAAWDHRCAAHQYRMMAAGHAHYAIYHRLLPWDHAAGVLLFQEAGGTVAMLDGRDYSPSVQHGGLICAPDAAGWHALHRAFFEA